MVPYTIRVDRLVASSVLAIYIVGNVSVKSFAVSIVTILDLGK